MVDAVLNENTSTVAVCINVSVNNSSRENHKLYYYVTVVPPVDSGSSSFMTENSTFQLSPLLHNHEYTVSVVANNCAGNSTPVAITVNISKPIVIIIRVTCR